MRNLRAVYFLMIIFVMCGCTSYQPKPLPNINQFLKQSQKLEQILSAQFSTPKELALISLAFSPDLNYYRATKKIESSQAIQAGIIPMPTLNLSRDFPRHPQNQITIGYYGALNWNIQQIIKNIFSSKTTAIKEKVRYDVAWQEWTHYNQVEKTAYKICSLLKQKNLIKKEKEYLEHTIQISLKDFEQYNLTIDQLALKKMTFIGLEEKYNQLSQTLNTTQSQLTNLLGVSPTTSILIQCDLNMPPLVQLDFKQYLKTAYTTRADIKALQKAYESEEAQVHQEVLSQFPLLTLRSDLAKDTSNIHTVGIGLNISLNLLTLNKANIELAKSSREQVYFEYQARLNQTRTDIQKALSQLKSLEEERQILMKNLPELKQVEKALKKAMDKGDKTFWEYETIRSTILNSELKIISLQEQIIEAQLNLQLAVGKL